MTRGNHSDLISENGPWYDPRGRDTLSPSILSRPAPGHPPGRHRRSGVPEVIDIPQPARKIRPKYIVAATLTALLAVPAFWMADYIATHDGPGTVPEVTRTAYLPMTLYGNGRQKPICVFITQSGKAWKAWAVNSPCEVALGQAGPAHLPSAGS